MRPPGISPVPLFVRLQACHALRPRRILQRSRHNPRLLLPSRYGRRSASAQLHLSRLNRFTLVAACLSLCLRFVTVVTSRHARLDSRWLAGPCRGGNSTLWTNTASSGRTPAYGSIFSSKFSRVATRLDALPRTPAVPVDQHDEVGRCFVRDRGSDSGGVDKTRRAPARSG
jgi:hypothetical protein